MILEGVFVHFALKYFENLFSIIHYEPIEAFYAPETMVVIRVFFWSTVSARLFLPYN